MRTLLASLLILIASCGEPAPVVDAQCILVQTDLIEGLEDYPPYASCVDANTGDRYFFLWSDVQAVLADGGYADAEWMREHMLPDEWFDAAGRPTEEAFP